MKNLKKKLLAGSVATFALSLAFGVSGCYFELPGEGGGSGDGSTETADFTYELVGDSYTIVGRGTDDAGILEFPSEYKGKPVTAIGEGAFNGDTELGKVVIPDSIVTIGESAFYNCVNLQSVTIGDGVTVIPKKTFMNCVFLNSVELPSALVTVGESAFQKCSRLMEVDFPDTVKVIAKNAFYNCTWLETVDFSTSLETIGDQAFANCVELKAVVIPDGAPTQIGERAFTIVDDSSGDLRMKNQRIELGNSVVSVGKEAFAVNARVRKLVLGDNLQELDVNAFYKCTKVFTISVGKNVPRCLTDEDKTPFTGCELVREVIDASGTLEAGTPGLGGILEGVWSVITPDKESKISYDETSHLVYYMGGDPYTKTDGAVVISSLLSEVAGEAQDIVIPDTYLGKPVTAIAERAFYNDLSVKSLDTGDNCQYIGESAFRNAYAILELKLGASVKTIAKYAFLNTNGLYTVYFNCGTNLTSVGAKSFFKKKVDSKPGELAGVPYKNVYFKCSQAEFETVKTRILGENGENENGDLFASGVNIHLFE